MEKVADIVAQHQAEQPDVQVQCLPEMGLHPQLFQVLRSREIETQLGQVQMNCEMCEFRLAVQGTRQLGMGMSMAMGTTSITTVSSTPYATPTQYHDRIWQIP